MKDVLEISVSDPDPDWYRIKEGKNDPQKLKKVEKFHVSKCWMFYSEGRRLFLLLRSPLWKSMDK